MSKESKETLEDSLAKMNGSGFVQDFKGTDYVLASITLSDWAAFEQFIKKQRLIVFSVIADTLPPEERMTMISSILRETVPFSMLHREFITTVQGGLFIMWKSLVRGGETGLTYEEVGDLVDFEDIDEMYTILAKISGGDSSDKEEGEGNEGPPKEEAPPSTEKAPGDSSTPA